jgi:hypothetical protein
MQKGLLWFRAHSILRERWAWECPFTSGSPDIGKPLIGTLHIDPHFAPATL